VANVPPLTVVPKPEITTREPSSAVMTPELLLIVAPPPLTSREPPPLASRVPVLLSVCPAAIAMTPAPAAKVLIVPVFVPVPAIRSAEVAGIEKVPVLVTPLTLTRLPLIPTTPVPAVANVSR